MATVHVGISIDVSKIQEYLDEVHREITYTIYDESEPVVVVPPSLQRHWANSVRRELLSGDIVERGCWIVPPSMQRRWTELAKREELIVPVARACEESYNAVEAIREFAEQCRKFPDYCSDTVETIEDTVLQCNDAAILLMGGCSGPSVELLKNLSNLSVFVDNEADLDYGNPWIDEIPRPTDYQNKPSNVVARQNLKAQALKTRRLKREFRSCKLQM